MNEQAQITTTHDDDTCTLESLCDRCAWAEFEQAIDPVKQPPTTFDTVWDSAPRSRRRLTTRSDAEYWFLRGRQWGMGEALSQSNADLKQLLKEDVIR